jgi:hypothetical protein
MKRSRGWSKAVAGALVALAPLLACADGTLSFVSDPGDWIGSGETYSVAFTDANANIVGDESSLSVDYRVGSDSWTLTLRAPQAQALTPACYERAQRAAFVDFSRPGLEFDHDAHGCNQVVGRFKLIELENDAVSGAISKLAVDFVQHCEGSGPALFGKLRYNSTVSLDTPALDPVFEFDGTLHFVSDPGDFVGQGEEGTFDLNRYNFFTRMNLYAGVSGFFRGATDIWNFDFAAPDSVPLYIGSFDDAVRFTLQGPGQAGFDFTDDGRGCDALSGNFDIDAIESDRIDGAPTRFGSHFVQHCENETPALTADVDFTRVYVNGPLVDDALFIDGVDGETAWPLVWNCE